MIQVKKKEGDNKKKEKEDEGNNYVGPGTYNVNYKQIEGSRTVGLDREQRFKCREVEEQTALTVKYD